MLSKHQREQAYHYDLPRAPAAHLRHRAPPSFLHDSMGSVTRRQTTSSCDFALAARGGVRLWRLLGMHAALRRWRRARPSRASSTGTQARRDLIGREVVRLGAAGGKRFCAGGRNQGLRQWEPHGGEAGVLKSPSGHS
jgi:hypothetical protein